ncbi:MAG: ammonia channel protein, partial [Chthoniobacteraceae bacterium]
FGVHCIGSIVGMVLLGLLASAEVNPLIAATFQKNGAAVSLVGSPGQLVNQLLGIAAAFALSALATFLLLKVIGATIGLRVDTEAEHAGLDISEHGESAYNE